jgi:hypothetical protein
MNGKRMRSMGEGESAPTSLGTSTERPVTLNGFESARMRHVVRLPHRLFLTITLTATFLLTPRVLVAFNEEPRRSSLRHPGYWAGGVGCGGGGPLSLYGDSRG